MNKNRLRRVGLTATALALPLLAGLLPSRAVGSGPTASSGCPPSAAALKTAIKARQSNGFNADPAHITQVACGPHIEPSRIGVPITSSENAELSRRTAVGETLYSIDRQQAQSVPNSYVGSWIEPTTGEAVFAFVSGAIPDEIAIRRSLPPGTPVRFETGVVTRDRRTDIQSAIIKNFATLRDSGLDIVGAYTDPQSGIVTIAIDQADRPDAEARLRATVGTEGVVVIRVDPDAWALATPEVGRTQPTGRQYGGGLHQ